MKTRKPALRWASIALALTLGASPADAKPSEKRSQQTRKVTHAERQAAAARAKAKGFKPSAVRKQAQKKKDESGSRAAPAGSTGATPFGRAATALLDMATAQMAAPRYFSHPNYANSPLPTVTGEVQYVGNPLVERAYATDFATPKPDGLQPVFVVLAAPLPDGVLKSFQTFNQVTPGGSPTPSAGGLFHAYVLRPLGGNEYFVVHDSGLNEVPPTATGGVETFPAPNIAVRAGDVLAFYGQGIPTDTGAGTDLLSTPAQNMPLQNGTVYLGGFAFPIYPQARTYSFGAEVLPSSSVTVAGGIRKFVDGLPGLDPEGANSLGQYIPIAVPDTSTYPGSDYYVIELGEYTERLHSDLPPTRLRGYRQAGGEFHYLGPAIVAQKNRPVRILFRNLLPTGEGGNLFIPVDSTVMGSGMTAMGHEYMEAHPEALDPQNPMCSGGGMMKAAMVASGHCFAENRATLHLHGGISPWISDGTPHQWITPAGEGTPYPEGVSVVDVPDMATPGPGEMTFFYTNQQSARLMFYHDHAWGITRLNVYAGEAAPYVITDDTEAALVASGVIPGPADTIPLVIQDKTFVPSAEQLAWQDETWDVELWGSLGSLWLPHVYSPAQNPGDASGVNQYGRWAYGPWFWPPTNNVDNGPIPNPYHDPACDPDLGWCEPPLMPGTPFVSMGMESFNDTPVVNGTAYPTLTVQPKPYRFRILSAANDRFFNLSLYRAVDANGVPCDAGNPAPAPESTGVACTEVALNPAEVAAALADPAGVFPTPVAGMEGPSWIQFGTEGGFLPSPVVIPPHVTTWVTDPTVFNAGNVDQHSLLLAPAERADVVVDFSRFAGQTLILYNDAPAAFPARDPRYDYYTGNPDLRDTGGAPPTLPGYGPNTRTVMQIKVAAAPPSAPYDVAALQAAFAHKEDGSGVFESGQHPIIVGQGAYNLAYGTTFGGSSGLAQIYDTSLTFRTLLGATLTMPLKPKMIQDEMGEAFELEYGRMSGFLGVETPNAQAGLQNMILHPYTYPPDEILKGIEVPPGVELAPIGSADDGSQIWKITHNGVDTHPIHFHLYDVQLLNRVGWDGIVRKPEANELGWKDTIRISPLEDTVVALRPVVPNLPAAWSGLPNSIRLLDPSMPEGVYLKGANTTQREAAGLPLLAFNPDGEPVDIVNHFVNYGWEYVWHCHILSHEEMDMMHSQVVGVAPSAPTDLAWTEVGTGRNRRLDLAWTDQSGNETEFAVQRRRAGSTAQWTTIGTVASTRLGVVPFAGAGTGPAVGGTITYSDVIGTTTTPFEYRVQAVNVVGDVWDYSAPAFNEIPPGGGFPTLPVASEPSNVATFLNGVTPPDAPTSLVATALLQNGIPAIRLVWFDNATNEDEFVVERAIDGGAFELLATRARRTGTGSVTFFDTTVVVGHGYAYRVAARNAAGTSAYSNEASVAFVAPAAPSALTVTPNNLNRTSVTLTWTNNATNQTGFQLQRATNDTFTAGLVTQNLGAAATSRTQTGLARRVTYFWRIRAVSNVTGPSAWSDTASITTQ